MDAVLEMFHRLSEIPRGSGNTKAVSDFCLEFARARGLRCRQDAANNVVIWKDASKGMEARPTVVIQGHLDMVCVKDADCPLDLTRDALVLRTNGDWLFAEGTSLGADDGIAVAYALALLDDASIPHPPLEIVLTADEEVGMPGARALDMSDLRGRIMLNLDSEEEGIFLTSCAGGARVDCTLPIVRKRVAGSVVSVRIDGLRGGHSGVDIDKHRTSANQLIGRLLSEVRESADFALLSLDGGEVDNAIACSAEARVVTADAASFCAAVAARAAVYRAECAETEPALRVETAEEPGTGGNAVCDLSGLLAMIQMTPQGVLAQSPSLANMVETSSNIGVLTMGEDAVTLSLCVRSSVQSRKEELLHRLRDLMAALGGTCSVSGDYPAWEYRAKSPLRDCIAAAYQRLTGHAATFCALHAGLECGIFDRQMEGLDCVSFGPEIEAIHTTRERMSLSSVARVWALILEVLRTIE